MAESSTIGAQLQKLRRERALTQAALAERAGVSQDLIAKLEQGTRQTARLTSLVRLARALDVELSQLVGRRPRMDRGADTGSLIAVRDVLISPFDLPGIDRHDDAGEATPIEELRRAVEAGWRVYWSGQFGRLAAMLPPLIGEARVTAAAEGGALAAGPLSQAYQLAACLMVHVGKDDAAAIGAERALHAAAQGSDELQWATLHGTYSWALLYQGRLRESEDHALRIAERIEPRLTTARPQHLTVWGGLLITALAAAAAAGRSDQAQEYISLSRAAAARLGRDRHDYRVSFGPTQVAMQATHAYTVLGNPGQALAAAKHVRREDLFGISYGRHLLDVGQAELDARRYDAATATLDAACDLSAEWFRHQGVARSMVAELVERQGHLTPALRRLARAVDVR